MNLVEVKKHAIKQKGCIITDTARTVGMRRGVFFLLNNKFNYFFIISRIALAESRC